jgi:hypothetical protein
MSAWRHSAGVTPRIAILLLGSLVVFNVRAERLDVGAFSAGSLAGWQRKAFKGVTEYGLVRFDGRTVLQASSEAAASGLYRELKVDLTRTPYLNWSWRVDRTLGNLNERSRSGDDYPARIYVIVSGGLAFWRTQALNYVWSSSAEVGTHWPNAFAGANVVMLALRSGDREAGHWVTEKRNVRDDWRRLFGDAAEQLDAVALMTDTDNAGGTARAYFGDIFFSSE